MATPSLVRTRTHISRRSTGSKKTACSEGTFRHPTLVPTTIAHCLRVARRGRDAESHFLGGENADAARREERRDSTRPPLNSTRRLYRPTFKFHKVKLFLRSITRDYPDTPDAHFAISVEFLHTAAALQRNIGHRPLNEHTRAFHSALHTASFPLLTLRLCCISLPSVPANSTAGSGLTYGIRCPCKNSLSLATNLL